MEKMYECLHTGLSFENRMSVTVNLFIGMIKAMCESSKYQVSPLGVRMAFIELAAMDCEVKDDEDDPRYRHSELLVEKIIYQLTQLIGDELQFNGSVLQLCELVVSIYSAFYNEHKSDCISTTVEINDSHKYVIISLVMPNKWNDDALASVNSILDSESNGLFINDPKVITSDKTIGGHDILIYELSNRVISNADNVVCCAIHDARAALAERVRCAFNLFCSCKAGGNIHTMIDEQEFYDYMSILRSFKYLYSGGDQVTSVIYGFDGLLTQSSYQVIGYIKLVDTVHYMIDEVIEYLTERFDEGNDQSS